MKTAKKILAALLAFALIVAGIYLVPTAAEEVQADATESEDGNYVTMPAQEAQDVGLKYTGYLFAGYYEDATCATPLTAPTETAVAKFVSEDVLNVNCQIATKTTTVAGYDNEVCVMRFISSVDTLNYSEVGFEVTYEGGSGKNSSKEVFERIDSTTDSVTYQFSPKVVDTKSEYFITAKMVVDENVDYTVKAYWITFDNQKVYGASRCVSVADGQKTTPLNLWFESSSVAKTDSLNATYGTGSTPAQNVEIVDVVDGIVHVRVTLDESDTKDGLSAATKFVFTEGTEAAGSTIYRNLYNGYTAEKTVDTSWYEVYADEEGNVSETEFIIASNADLYGLEEFTKLSTEIDTDAKTTLLGKTFYLVSDIYINQGSLATNWTNESGPENSWVPIGGTSRTFSATFDGQGHTISGMYVVGTNYQGLFAVTGADAKVRDFRLENSYVYSSHSGSAMVGSIAGRGNGKFETIYSDAIIEAPSANYCGGLFGQANVADTEYTNCWFNGEINLTGTANYAGGIVAEIRQSVNVKECVYTGQITVSADAPYIGGLCGWAQSGNANLVIDNCLSLGEVTAKNGTNTYAGSIIGIVGKVGSNQAAKTTITNTYVDSTDKNQIGQSIGTAAVVNDEKVGSTKEVNDVATLFDKTYDLSWYTLCEKENVLYDASDLYGFYLLSVTTRDFVDETIRLGADIVVNEGTPLGEDIESTEDDWATVAPTLSWEPIPSFAGTFDGSDPITGDIHEISGIYLKTDATYAGLFAQTKSTAFIQNLELKNSYFEFDATSGHAMMGSIVGRSMCSMERVFSDAIIKSNRGYCGGLVGQFPNAGNDEVITILDCAFTGSLSLTGDYGRYGGGIIGETRDTVVMKHCLVNGSITADNDTNEPCIGGFVGQVHLASGSLILQDSLNVGNVTAKGAMNTNVGSLIGSMTTNTDATIKSTYVTNQSCAQAIGATDETVVVDGKEIPVDDTNLKGDLALTNASELSFTDKGDGIHWVEGAEGELPMLKCFSNN